LFFLQQNNIKNLRELKIKNIYSDSKIEESSSSSSVAVAKTEEQGAEISKKEDISPEIKEMLSVITPEKQKIDQ